MIKMRIHWKRLIWVIFICLYSGLFFYNFFNPFGNWFLAYIYTILLVVWLGVEYYEQRLFFQTGFVPIELYSWPLRALFALFFYSSFIIGVSTIVWWHKNQIGFYPFIQITGLMLLIFSIFIRRRTISKGMIKNENISQFYLSITILMCSVALGYGSKFSIAYVVIIGAPLILLEKRLEQMQFKRFENYLHSKKTVETLEEKDYIHLWHQYFDKQLKKKKKK